jgi:MOSC domain-containing protein YiiM
MKAEVVAVSLSSRHSFTKPVALEIRLLSGLGVEGDVHCGVTMQDSYNARKNSASPNLRQVHLIHEELHDDLRAAGFQVSPGVMGENITTRGVDLLGLPEGTRLHLGDSAVVELTGVRTPCRQLNDYQKGLMSAVVGRNADGSVLYKSGVMAIVLESGVVRPGDTIRAEFPREPFKTLVPI